MAGTESQPVVSYHQRWPTLDNLSAASEKVLLPMSPWLGLERLPRFIFCELLSVDSIAFCTERSSVC